MTTRHAILQLDFDGTLVQGDVNEAIFRRFVSEEWTDRIESASRELARDPSSPALIDALRDATANLAATDDECLAFATDNNPPRDGLPDLIEAAKRYGMECHVVSYGFEFYIHHYLQMAGVENDLEVHGGGTARGPAGRLLQYTGPQGQDVSADWKVLWSRAFRERAEALVYVGDGGSDLAPALLCDVVFARDRLLSQMPMTYAGMLESFDTLHDVARGLEELFG